MEKRIEPLLPKGSNAGKKGERGEGGDCMKFSFGKETPRRDRALWKTYIFALVWLSCYSFGQLAMMTARTLAS